MLLVQLNEWSRVNFCINILRKCSNRHNSIMQHSISNLVSPRLANRRAFRVWVLTIFRVHCSVKIKCYSILPQHLAFYSYSTTSFINRLQDVKHCMSINQKVSRHESCLCHLKECLGKSYQSRHHSPLHPQSINLGVILNPTVSLKSHLNSITETAFFYLHIIGQTLPFPQPAAQIVLYAFITFCLLQFTSCWSPFH